MIAKEGKLYSASFTSGGLLHEETVALVKYFNRDSIDLINEQIVNNSLIEINSQTSRKRIISELVKRYNAVNNDQLFAKFKDCNTVEQKVLLYYVCLKTYPLMFDFVFDVVIEKWLSMDMSIKSIDVLRFLEKQSNQHKEIEKWTDKTLLKISSLIIKLIKDVGLINHNNLTKLELPNSFLRIFVDWKDEWFLQAILLNKSQRESVSNG